MYFPIRNAGFVLLDIFPVRDREVMLEGLRRLLVESELPAVPSEGVGILGGSWSLNLGSPKEKPPPPIEWVEVELGQCISFYYVLYKCYIEPSSQNHVKPQFLDARMWVSETLQKGRILTRRKGPELEPTIRQYQMQTEGFLSEFAPGIFLSEKSAGRIRCPSIRILTADRVDFEHFEEFFRGRIPLFEFLGTGLVYSRNGPYLISYQEDRLFKETGMFAGLNLIVSHSDLASVPSEMEAFYLASDFLHLGGRMEYFVALYWSTRQLELELRKWEDLVSGLETRLKVALEGRSSFDSVKKLYEDNARLLSQFENYAFAEEKNIANISGSLARLPRPKSEPVRFSTGNWPEMDVLADIADGADHFLGEEHERLEFMRRRTLAISEQCSQRVDFTLQASMHSLTRLATLIALVALAIALIAALAPYFGIILSWFASTVGDC